MISPVEYTNQTYDIDEHITRGVSIQAHISDIHFGIIDPETEYNILTEQFTNKIATIPQLDCISIDGDLFDRLMMSNCDAVMYACLFVSDLVQICKNNKLRGVHTVLVIIAGTRNHDAGQLRLFYPYLDDPDIDIRIIENISFENINGCKVLCIPELYNIPDSVYNQYFYDTGSYDMVFGHGSIMGSVINNGQSLSRFFGPEDFDFCNGPVVFGHIHTGGSFHGFCYYNGSPIRWCFGEEETKGFQLVLYDMDSRKYYVHKEPIYSFRYITLNIDDILSAEPDKIIEYIQKKKEDEKIDYIRLSCVSTEQTKTNINILRDYYKTDKTVKFKIDTDELYDQYKYFFDKSLSPYEIFAKFVNESQQDIVVTADKVIDVLKNY